MARRISVRSHLEACIMANALTSYLGRMEDQYRFTLQSGANDVVLEKRQGEIDAARRMLARASYLATKYSDEGRQEVFNHEGEQWVCRCGKVEGERNKVEMHREKSIDRTCFKPAYRVVWCCDEQIVCDSFTNTCEECGADYNMGGDRLAPRSQWGEETGESAADVLSIH